MTVVGWHVARALAPAEMRESLTREGPHPAAGSTFGHIHGEGGVPRAGLGGRAAGPPEVAGAVGREAFRYVSEPRTADTGNGDGVFRSPSDERAERGPMNRRTRGGTTGDRTLLQPPATSRRWRRS